MSDTNDINYNNKDNDSSSSILSLELKLKSCIVNLRRLLHCMTIDPFCRKDDTTTNDNNSTIPPISLLSMRVEMARSLLYDITQNHQQLQTMISHQSSPQESSLLNNNTNFISSMIEELQQHVEQTCHTAEEIIATAQQQQQSQQGFNNSNDVIDDTNATNTDWVHVIFEQPESTRTTTTTLEKQQEEVVLDEQDNDNDNDDDDNEEEEEANHHLNSSIKGEPPMPLASAFSVEELQKQQRQQLENEISIMAQQLKKSTQSMHTTLQHQTQDLSEMEDLAVDNVDRVTQVAQDTQDHVRQSWKTSFMTYTMIFVILGSFFTTFMVIRIVPKRSNTCIPFFTCPRHKRAQPQQSQQCVVLDDGTTLCGTTRTSSSPPPSSSTSTTIQVPNKKKKQEENTKQEKSPSSSSSSSSMECKTDSSTSHKEGECHYHNHHTSMTATSQQHQEGEDFNQVHLTAPEIHGDVGNEEEKAVEAEVVEEDEVVDEEEEEEEDGTVIEEEEVAHLSGEVLEKEVKTGVVVEEEEEMRAEVVEAKEMAPVEAEIAAEIFQEEEKEAEVMETGETVIEEEVMEVAEFEAAEAEGGETSTGNQKCPLDSDGKCVTNFGAEDVATAASNDDVEALQYYLSLKPHYANSVDENGWQPMHEATRYGHTETLRVLLKLENVDVNARIGGHGMTPLELAYSLGLNKDHDAVKLLKFHGGSISSSSSSSIVADNDDENLGVEEHDNDINVDGDNQDEYSAINFRVAAQHGDIDLLNEILLRVDDPKSVIDDVDENGWSALHEAARNSEKGLDTIRFFVSTTNGGCNMNLKTKKGQTALDLAIEIHGSNHDIVKFLRQHTLTVVDKSKNSYRSSQDDDEQQQHGSHRDEL